MPRGRVYIRTLGCPKNEVDGADLTRHLEQDGWTVVNDPAAADAEIINTCGFVEAAKRDSIQAIWEGVERKQSASTDRKLIVTGCLAQRYPKQLVAEIRSLDAVVGFNRPDLVARALTSERGCGNPACWVEKPESRYREHTSPLRIDAAHPVPLSAYVKIGDGCDNACRFCAIPLIRGRLRSRSPAAILDEIRCLVASGAKEFILVSQDTTSWGRDLGNGSDLGTLLPAINAIPGDFWIRLMYAHPAFLSDRHIDVIGGCEKVVPYIDLPLQHISDRMLRIMNRHTTRKHIEGRIDRLRRCRPDMALRTTFMIGHPGETQADMAELLSFAEAHAFERMGCFAYSPEDGTPSARLRRRVSRVTAQERLSRLMEAYDRWSAMQSVDKIGQVVRCLVERVNDEEQWEGRTAHDAPDIDGVVAIAGGQIDAPGWHDIRVTAAEGVDLTGEPVCPPDRTRRPVRPSRSMSRL